MASDKGLSRNEFLEIAATRVAFQGAKIQGNRLIPDEGYTLEPDPDKPGTAMLRQRAGGGPGDASVSCVCALEGGGCAFIVVSPGDIDEYGACVPDGGCGSSGLFCFMEVGFAGGLGLRIAMA